MSTEDESSGWQLTESDPGVFTELLKTLGVPLIVDDLYSLDPDSLHSLSPIHALIFLFKWVSPQLQQSSSAAAGTPDPTFPGFFAHQTVNNACATLAVLNALGNIPLPPSQNSPTAPATKNEEYTALMSFASTLDPTSRGIVITTSDWLREAHNSLSPPSAISLDGLIPEKDREKEDAYHFVVYLPVTGVLYELDGLKEYAVRHGAWEEGGEGWLSKAREVIEARIATYPGGALEFSLLALRDDPLPKLHAQLAQIQSSGDHAMIEHELMMKIEEEDRKREQWAFENALRRHNHLGLLHVLLLALGKAGKLDQARESAKEAMRGRRAERERERGAAGKE
jgi:ubiquitin carboxyl-terminal hydrolase L5